MSEDLTKLIAFYLPQFHPIPENDEWWGKGFTEWTNVVRGKPLFRGHEQPHLPADLGFYDLRLPETREAQAALAKEYGISGFCYYHYWFGGRRLLERPFNEVLRSGSPDLPFCLCWANENWARTWDGRGNVVLMRQDYSEEDDLAHIRALAEAFRDERYIRVDGKPLFLVYRASLLPDPLRTTTIWREEARRLGLGDLHLCRVESFIEDHDDPRPLGFDAAVEFQPDWSRLPDSKQRGRWAQRARRLVNLGAEAMQRGWRVYDYGKTVERMLRPRDLPYTLYPCVTPRWDNTARKGNKAVVFHGSTPERYERWLRTVIERSEQRATASGTRENLVFVNAWNEWAEGAHLEPDQRWGRAYLEATRRAREVAAPVEREALQRTAK
jgi:lipopolysaccharide biosynthesis protein